MRDESTDGAERLAERLSRLLGSLDDPATDGATFEAAGDELDRLVADLRSALATPRCAGAGSARELRDALEQVLGLNAVARELATRRLATLGSRLDLVRAAQRARGSQSSGRAGDWCDVDA
jgi:hypothetical protein